MRPPRFPFPLFLAASLAVLSALAPPASADGDVCWRDSYGRGVGTIPGECEMHEDKSGLLCYPKCKPGYTGVSFVCWQDCPTGFRDDGAFCAKPAPYGRGAGFPWKFGDKAFSLDGARKRCQAKHGRGNCEKSGQIIYPKCRKGYKPVGCCVCSPECPAGMGTDIGVSCTKKSYTRKTISPSCPAGMVNDAGLCYKKCKPGYNGVGPVCWGTCPKDRPVNCGAACAKSSGDCALAVTDQVVSVTDIVSNIALSVVTGGAGGAAKAVATRGVKTAAKAGAKAATKAAKNAAKKVSSKAAIRASAKQAMKTASKKLDNISKAKIKQSLRTMRNKARKKGSKDAEKITDEDIERMADALDKARTATEAGVDPPQDVLEVMEMVDPTGIVAVVNAYNKPICSAPSSRPATTRPTPGRAASTANGAGRPVRINTGGGRRRPPPPPPPAPPKPAASPRPATGVDAACVAAVQGKIAWDFQGNKSWMPGNVNRLCKGSVDSQAAWCFARGMHAPNYFGHFKAGSLNWGLMVDLCEGSRNADATLGCFGAKVAAGMSFAAATAACDERARDACPAAVQGKVAWAKGGSKRWVAANVARLCGTAPGDEPARCFDGLIQGRGPARKDGKPWAWPAAIDLCKGATDAAAVHRCYGDALAQGLTDAAASERCGFGRKLD